MGWNNPPIPWAELEARLSGRVSPDDPLDPDWARLNQSPLGRSPERRPALAPEPDPAAQLDRNGDPIPPWSRSRRERGAPPSPPQQATVPYAELHSHSNFSFLDGASDPEDLIEEAVRLGLTALAITDHDGLYAVARFAEAAQGYDLATIYGAELSLGLRTPQNGVADPEGSHLLVLARGVEGYHRLAAAITEAQLRGDEKGRPLYDLDELAAAADGHWTILTGCRKGRVRQALAAGGAEAAAQELDRLTALFGHDRVVVELIDHGRPDDSTINDALVELAGVHDLPVVATNNVHYAQPRQYRLASADGRGPGPAQPAGDGRLAAGAGGAPAVRGGDGPDLRPLPGGDRADRGRGARSAPSTCRLAKPRLPKLEVPPGHTPISWLRELTRRGVEELYPDRREIAYERLQRELAVIEEKDFPGYFLIVHDMVDFARKRGILCQGRGSAANSVVCYVLDITAVDPILYGLPFERFLSATRDEEPDIDVDFDSDRREEVIQEVYRRYGRRNAAQVANVISYRPKSAVRDMAKALGHSAGQQDAWSKQIDSWGAIPVQNEHDIPAPVVELADELLSAPRHLGIHSGGMVLTERPVGEVCPIERGRMDDRTVLQWDKDSCAWMGLVKFDFLGLGILSAMQYTLDLVAARLGETLDAAVAAQGGGRGLRHALPGRLDRGVPGGEPGPGRHPAPVAAAEVLRPGDRDRADPARPDPGRGGAPLHPAGHRPGGGHLPARGAEAGAGADPGGAAVPGAADADRHRGRRLHRRRRRPAAPGDGLQAGRGEDRAAARRSSTRGWPCTASPARWPTRSTPGSRRSPTSASPRATRSASPCWCTRARG